ncbi:hypothetical protein [Paenibacillus tarimensis]
MKRKPKKTAGKRTVKKKVRPPVLKRSRGSASKGQAPSSSIGADQPADSIWGVPVQQMPAGTGSPSSGRSAGQSGAWPYQNSNWPSHWYITDESGTSEQ